MIDWVLIITNLKKWLSILEQLSYGKFSHETHRLAVWKVCHKNLNLHLTLVGEKNRTYIAWFFGCYSESRRRQHALLHETHRRADCRTPRRRRVTTVGPVARTSARQARRVRMSDDGIESSGGASDIMKLKQILVFFAIDPFFFEHQR
jgi:hypothetical protein